ncbi:MAG TPA: DEAD/DEAH box helicase family protein [Povalibacter sp.]|uniref:DEAD/DEAH box helicase family protein n=1 Tax=Povalibacter sp. TaxID=1962978 RepID=UPI002C227B75|nr:DEAD/DEAH box helicase family protein [Povalibacter sp.]HMN44675.1 DEAD/DEAH box helicase family protein [Povalibacter sp.]
MDYSKLGKRKKDSNPQTLLELFDQLDRKATHNSLRPVQIEALEILQKQIAERDILLKVSTGSGKTLVGLIYAEFMRRKYASEPALYLCPTNQLADQVADSAAMIGVAAEICGSDGLPLRALEGKSVLIVTYDRLFNARSVLAKKNVQPSVIVMDDVHAGLDRVRQKYTLNVPPAVYPEIRQIFQRACEETDAAVWRGIANNEINARYEVPYWLWSPQVPAVAELLSKFKDDEALSFEWNNVSRYLDYARLCISGAAAEVSLGVAAVEENGSYASAKHRLFMSASIKDGSSLLRDLCLDPKALGRIIEPPSDRGAGERMILPISLIDSGLEKLTVAKICAEASVSANVVVLTSSAKQASVWVEAGAKLKQGKDVDAEIADLRASKRGKYVVFAQRYDGVDLPDDACRILVIDGTPGGERLCDQIDVDRQKNSPGYNSRTVNRFEQALGRAVRSSADYAAVLLVGNDLAAFIGRKDVKQALEPHTREQIELGQDVAEQLREDTGKSEDGIRSAISTLVKRDPTWKEAHRERMAGIEKGTRAAGGLTVLERAALAEREAWIDAKARNHQRAVDVIRAPTNDEALHPIQRAELMLRAAGYLYRVNPAQAAGLYRSAFQLNSALPRPMELADKRYARINKQVVNLSEYLTKFSTVNAALARLEEIRAMLSYSGDSGLVEEGLRQLGEMLGATSSRPERETGRGPDVLWLFDANGICIEAKNEKYRPVFKKDAEQLLMSMQWCVDHGDLERAALTAVFATDVTDADRSEDVSFGPSIMTEVVLQAIVERLRKVLLATSYDGPLFADPKKLQGHLVENGLRGEDIAALLTRTKAK